MKVGDKIYCKRTCIKDGGIWVTKDKIYDILLDHNNVFCIIDDEDDTNSIIVDVDIFDQYFYTKQELRKQKIQKLNDNF